MANLNKCILCGYLTRDPELKYTSSGTAVGAFGLAMNREWKDHGGQKQTETCFVDITAFGKQAETIAQYVKKGSALLVEGRLKLDQWEDKQSGEQRQKLKVVLESFSFLDAKGVSEDRPATPTQPRANSAPRRANPARAPRQETFIDDGKDEPEDVPF